MQHVLCWRDHFGSSGHASKVGARLGVVPCKRVRLGVPNARTVLWYKLSKCLPGIGVKDTLLSMFDGVIEPLQGGSSTTTKSPGHRAPCATIHRCDKPNLAVFAWRKCHMASQAISRISPAIVGASLCAAASRI